MKDLLENNFKELLELLPGIVHVNELVEGTPLVYLNKTGCEKLEMTQEKFHEFDKVALNNHLVHEESMVNISPLLHDLIQDENQDRVITFFQKIRGVKSENYFWILTTSRFVKGRYLISISNRVSSMDFDKKRIDTFLEDRLLAKRYQKMFNSLTSREKEVLTCFGQGMYPKLIATNLSISEKAIRNYIHSIKTKFFSGEGNLPSQADLLTYARIFCLI